MDRENLKRPGSQYTTFKYIKSTKNIKETEHFPKSPEATQAKPRPIYHPIIIEPLISNSSVKPSQPCVQALARILEKLKQLSPIDLSAQSESANREYQERFEELQRILDHKRKLNENYQQQLKRREEEHENFVKALTDVQEKSKAAQDEKEMIEYRRTAVKRTLKFLKDFSSLELLDVLEKPRGFSAIAKYEGKFIRFRLVECEGGLEYHMINSNIMISMIPEAFKEDIVFERPQFPHFYMALMEFLHSVD